MNIRTESYGHAVVLILRGELGIDSLGALKDAVARQLDRTSLAEGGASDGGVIDLVLDMEEVPFVDSVALEYLLDLQDSLAERLGQVKLVKPDENVLTILEMTRLKSAFEVFPDVPAAAKVRAH